MKPYFEGTAKVYGRRAMLNPPGHHSTGSIVAEVAKTKYGWETTLQVTDCSRAVVLSLYGPDTDSDEDHDADLYKIDVMIDALRELRKGLKRARRQCGR